MNKIKQKFCKESRKESEIKMAFFDSIHLVPNIWDQLVEQESLYLTTKYLAPIEEAMSESMGFRYILFTKEDKAVAVAIYQLVNVDSESLELETEESKRKKIVSKVLDQVNIRCLVNGTLFGAGEHGFFFSDELSPEVAFKHFSEGAKKLIALEETCNKVHIIMVKEYFPESLEESNELKKFKFRNFKMEPNMVLKLDPTWGNMDDYYAAMTSKYRKAAKATLKKSNTITAKNFTADDIARYQTKLAQLFEAVHSKAKYKFATFDISSFIGLKENLDSKFEVWGYFLEDKLVGFSSLFLNNTNLDANYVGLDYEHNRNYGIYQRILYDFVKIALEKNLSTIYFGRTAGEIKSNLGAKAVDMECYVRTKNSLSNKMIKPLIKRISTPDFVERNPFKKE